jgi:Protein of unknown function (DUF1800)
MQGIVMNLVSTPVVAALAAIFLAPMSPRSAPPPGDATTPMAAESLTFGQARHLLMRAGFGGSPRQIERLRAMGVAAAVRHLVRFASIPTTLRPHGVTLGDRPSREQFRKLDEDGRRKLRQKLRREDARKLNDLRAWWIGRMLKSPRPLEEKMTLFWHGLLTSGYRDVRNAHHLAIQNDLYRTHAVGNFAKLVQAVAKDPAMLEYLDNNRNNRRAPNENFARELMELFTLGEGNYTEKDIKEAARALTGWTFRRSDGKFFFNRGQHDFGEKTFLGKTGKLDGGDIIGIIFKQAEAPRHLARKLLEFFAVKPTEAELEPYAELLRSSRFELAPFFTTLFSSKWFYSDRVLGQQVKSPVVLAISTLRMMDRTELPRGARMALAAACRSIGQDLFQPPNVKGWDGGAAWVTSSNLLTRFNLTRAFVGGAGLASGSPRRGRSPGARGRRGRSRARGARGLAMIGRTSHRFFSELRASNITEPRHLLKALEARFLVVPLAPSRRQALMDFLTGADGSPAIDLRDKSPRWSRKLKELLHLLTTTPEFQVT